MINSQNVKSNLVLRNHKRFIKFKKGQYLQVIIHCLSLNIYIKEFLDQ